MSELGALVIVNSIIFISVEFNVVPIPGYAPGGLRCQQPPLHCVQANSKQSFEHQEKIIDLRTLGSPVLPLLASSYRNKHSVTQTPIVV